MRPSNRDMAAQPPTFHLDTGPQGQRPRKQSHRVLPTAAPGTHQVHRPHLLHSTCCPATGPQTQAPRDRDAALETGPDPEEPAWSRPGPFSAPHSLTDLKWPWSLEPSSEQGHVVPTRQGFGVSAPAP